MKVFVSIFYKKGENHVENEKIKKDRYSEIFFFDNNNFNAFDILVGI